MLEDSLGDCQRSQRRSWSETRGNRPSWGQIRRERGHRCGDRHCTLLAKMFYRERGRCDHISVDGDLVLLREEPGNPFCGKVPSKAPILPAISAFGSRSCFTFRCFNSLKNIWTVFDHAQRYGDFRFTRSQTEYSLLRVRMAWRSRQMYPCR